MTTQKLHNLIGDILEREGVETSFSPEVRAELADMLGSDWG